MGDPISERIEGWRSAGLIDAVTAERLLAAEASGPSPEDEGLRTLGTARSAAGYTGFSLELELGDVFGYLGLGFVLAAWYAILLNRIIGVIDLSDPAQQARYALWYGGGTVAAGLATAIGGLAGRGRIGALTRAAGPLLLAGTIQVFLGAEQIAEVAAPHLSTPAHWFVAALVFAAGAVVARGALNALPTQAALYVALDAVGLTAATALGEALWPLASPAGDGGPASAPAGAYLRTLLLVGGPALASLAIAALARGARGRALAFGRLSAGLSLALGVGWAIAGAGTAGWSLDPWFGTVALGTAAILLLAAAARTAALAYAYPAALAAVLTLSVFNVGIVRGAVGDGPAFLFEGLALVAVGLTLNRWRGQAAVLHSADQS